MIVSCDSCKSRYKLDDSKITGRGAKITCPKCKHVFVVYAAGAEPPAAPPAPSGGSPWEEEEPTRIGLMKAAAAAAAGGVAVGAPSAPPGKPPPPMLLPTPGQPVAPPVAAPPLNGQSTLPRANPTLAFPVDDAVRPNFAPPPPPPGLASVSPSEAAARAAALDFRKVGVPTWKVKVRIGLVYDFSDIKTLRKYIQDGRVTPSDVISYDGRAWKPIGEIPDLDVFFVETYDLLARQRGESVPEAPGARADAAAAERAATPPPSPADSTFKDPFEEMRRAQKAAGTQPVRRAPAPAPSGSKLPYVVVGIVILAFLGGAWWWAQERGAPSGGRSASTARPAAAPAAPSQEDVRARIQADLQAGLEPIADEPPPEAPAAPYDLVPVGPRDGIPAGAVPVKPSDGVTGGTKAARPSGVVTAPSASEKDATAADHEAIGDASSRSGDWAGAVRAYQNAVSLDPASGRLLKKLGEAQYRTGSLDAATATLQSAQAKGQTSATKLLAQIARDQGDIANATYLYQQYLATSPKDAAEVERILAELAGGG